VFAGPPRKITLLSLLLLICPLSPAGAQGEGYIRQHYSKIEYMIPMRDGVRLFTEVYAPRDDSQEYPILLKRTPYGLGTYGADRYKATLGPSAAFGREGYIFVYQDIRGKFRSEGFFEHHRPYIPDKDGPGVVDEASDAFDTIDWLLEHIPGHNGRVGLWGISYPGWLAVMGLIEPHPAVRAASPQASPADQWVGDDYYHNGAVRLMYAFDWTWQCAQPREGPTELEVGGYDYGTHDGYRFFLELGPISNVNRRHFHGRIPMWNELIEHWSYDAYWQEKNTLAVLPEVSIPVLNVAGWFDAEDFYGPLGIYAAIERTPSNRSTLVIGPWSHGGWAYQAGDRLGLMRFGSDTARFFRQQVELPFFNYYLKDKGEPNLAEALVFETGANRWHRYESWPPPEAGTRRLYLRPEGGLSFDPPSDPQGFPGYDSFVSDPSSPVPYTAWMQTIQGHLWMVEDQRFAAGRPDVLVYRSEALQEELRLAGPVEADLYISTTGSDADWVVKLIDEWPAEEPGQTGGPQLLLAAEVMRAKFRESFTDPEALVPGRITRIRFGLPDRHHGFGKGHRIMVQVQASWFPLIDRNPQVFLPIPEAGEEDFQIATHRVHYSPRYPSSLLLTVLP
jgi:putative CocE/NonD family hydrolase